MANTKHLSREDRKAAKRAQRKELKKLFASLTPEQKRKFRKSEEPIGLKAFIAQEKAEKAS